MPYYSFTLHDGDCSIRDEGSWWFPDRERAVEHAEHVAGELMRGREVQTRGWCLDVYEGEECVHQVLFATIDQTLDHLSPSLRMTVEEPCYI
jgi:hypothetical protein